MIYAGSKSLGRKIYTSTQIAAKATTDRVCCCFLMVFASPLGLYYALANQAQQANARCGRQPRNIRFSYFMWWWWCGVCSHLEKCSASINYLHAEIHPKPLCDCIPILNSHATKRRVETVLSSPISPIWQLENICSEIVLSSWFHLYDNWRTFVVKLCYHPDFIYMTTGEHL